MVTKGKILRSLQRLSALYARPPKAGDELYFAKLAIIEVGGWVEQTMDEIINSRIKIKLSATANQKFLDSEIVRRTHGFEYEQHFRGMLIKSIGIVGVEKLETLLNTAKFGALKRELVTLKTIRDSLAHTHIHGATTTIDAPSISIGRLEKIYDGLIDYERTLRKLKI